MRQATVLVLITLLLLPPAAEAAGLFAKLRGRDAAADGMFPGSGVVDGLEKVSKVTTYRSHNLSKHFGEFAGRYAQYGLQDVKVCEYDFGGPGERLVVEIGTMDSVDAAAGLFHFYRAKVVAGSGKPVDIGTEGIIDAGRGSRTIYFYKANLFVKIIYSGKTDSIPDIVPVARAVDARIKNRGAEKPLGFKYIDIPGVDMRSVAVTPGRTFNIQELPPAVWASSPGGGSTASDLFIITRRGAKEATQVAKDYAAWLRMLGENFEEFRRGKQRFYQAVDPSQGRVIFTAYKHVVIIAARPDGFDKGEALIEAVMRKIDADG